MVNRRVINYGGNECVAAYFFKWWVMSFPMVHFAINTASYFISYTKAAIMNNGCGIPITMGNMRLFRVAYNDPYYFSQIATFVCRAIKLRAMSFAYTSRRLPRT